MFLRDSLAEKNPWRDRPFFESFRSPCMQIKLRRLDNDRFRLVTALYTQHLTDGIRNHASVETKLGQP